MGFGWFATHVCTLLGKKSILAPWVLDQSIIVTQVSQDHHTTCFMYPCTLPSLTTLRDSGSRPSGMRHRKTRCSSPSYAPPLLHFIGVRGAQLAVTAHVMPAWSGAGLGRLSLRHATPVLEQKCPDFTSKNHLKPTLGASFGSD